MKILVINSGSSSVKYELFDMTGPTSIATGTIGRIGETVGSVQHIVRLESGERCEESQQHFADHREALRNIVESLNHSGLLNNPGELDGIGHRVVHGGEVFHQPTLLDERVLAQIREQSSLAPLHNPANLLGIQQTLQAYPHVPQVAVFDTAFHQSLPPHAYLYAIPYEYYERLGVRRYGFHGTSHCFVAKAAAKYLGRPLDSLRLITIHLGNGASAAAIDRGKSIDTSMGLTPLEGLMMGTRSGDMDPAVLPFLAEREGLTWADIDEMLNKRSGLKGICGENDMREILRRVDERDVRAELALKMYSYRIKKYLGAYLAVLGGADAVVFTAGIGENAPRVRDEACTGLAALGIKIDNARNSDKQAGVFEIQAADSQVVVLVVPTDEELEIAIQTQQCLASGS